VVRLSHNSLACLWPCAQQALVFDDKRPSVNATPTVFSTFHCFYVFTKGLQHTPLVLFVTFDHPSRRLCLPTYLSLVCNEIASTSYCQWQRCSASYLFYGQWHVCRHFNVDIAFYVFLYRLCPYQTFLSQD
jgi:hypothetical protein